VPPGSIFGRQGLHSGGHISFVPPLVLPLWGLSSRGNPVEKKMANGSSFNVFSKTKLKIDKETRI
jgi:hypothetical protein